MSDSTATRIGRRVAQPQARDASRVGERARTGGQSGRRRRSAGSRGNRGVDPPAARDDHQAMGLEARARRWARPRPARRAGPRAPGPRPRAPSSTGPRFQATRTPPGATQRQPELHELRERADRPRRHHGPRLAVAPVAGDAPRPARSPPRRGARGRSPRRPSAGSGPSCPRSRRAARGPPPARRPAGGPGTRRPSRGPAAAVAPRPARSGAAASESRTWSRATRLRVADRREVDRARSRRAGAGVGVDRLAGLGRQREAEGVEPGVEHRVVRRGGGARGPERASGADLSGGPGHPPVWSCAVSPGSRSRRRSCAAAGVSSVWRHPVGSGPGLPGAPCGWRAPSARPRAECGR